jgi:hypothetical protein
MFNVEISAFDVGRSLFAIPVDSALRPSSKGIFASKPKRFLARETSSRHRGWP